MKTFETSQLVEIHNYYHQNGYVVVKDLIPNSNIESLLEDYEAFKRKKFYLINAQDTNRPEKLKISENGFIINSIMDPIDLPFAGGFPKSIMNIIFNNSVSKILEALSKFPKHDYWQSMFFDLSTGTVPHQDSYYLDSDPPGKLIGIWFSLEDIKEEAGAFYIYPESNKINKTLFKGETEHSEYVKKMKDYLAKENLKKQNCFLKKGEVLFWNAFTIHGSNENTNPNYSRKSITTHFIPSNEKRNNSKIPKLVNSKITGLRTKNYSQIKTKGRYLKTIIQYLINTKLSNSIRMEMKSKRYT